MPLFVDVTSLVSVPRFTGVQRVVISVVRDNPDFRLLSFDARLGGYRELEKAPEFDLGKGNQRSALILLSFLWATLNLFGRLRFGKAILAHLRRIATQIYLRMFSKTEVSSLDWTSDKLVSLSDNDHVWLLDVPKSDEHMAYLEEFASVKRGNFHAFLYDIIPLESPTDSGESRPIEDVNHYARYVRLVSRARSLLCLSHFTKHRFLHYCSEEGVPVPELIQVQYPPWDQSFESSVSSNSPPEVGELSRWIPLKAHDDKMIFAISPFTARKNLVVVFRAYSKLKGDFPGLKLLVVAPSLAQLDFVTVAWALWLRFRYRHQVCFLRTVTDQFLCDAYRRASLTVVPSRLEGFGLPIVEALHFGSPVVASDAGVFRELAGTLPIRLVNPDSTDEWAEAMGEALQAGRSIGIPVTNILPTAAEFGQRMRDISAR